MGAGGDFVRKVARQTAKDAYDQFLTLTETLAEGSWFIGQVSTDKKTITHPSGQIFDLVFTGNIELYQTAYIYAPGKAWAPGSAPIKTSIFYGGKKIILLLRDLSGPAPIPMYVQKNNSKFLIDTSESITGIPTSLQAFDRSGGGSYNHAGFSSSGKHLFLASMDATIGISGKFILYWCIFKNFTLNAPVFPEISGTVGGTIIKGSYEINYADLETTMPPDGQVPADFTAVGGVVYNFAYLSGRGGSSTYLSEDTDGNPILDWVFTFKSVMWNFQNSQRFSPFATAHWVNRNELARRIIIENIQGSPSQTIVDDAYNEYRTIDLGHDPWVVGSFGSPDTKPIYLSDAINSPPSNSPVFSPIFRSKSINNKKAAVFIQRTASASDEHGNLLTSALRGYYYTDANYSQGDPLAYKGDTFDSNKAIILATDTVYLNAENSPFGLLARANDSNSFVALNIDTSPACRLDSYTYDPDHSTYTKNKTAKFSLDTSLFTALDWLIVK